MGRARLFLIDAALVVGGVVLTASALMKIGEWALGRPAVSWGVSAQDWALAAVCSLIFAGALCLRSLVAGDAAESELDLDIAEEAPELPASETLAPEPPAREVRAPLFPAPVSAPDVLPAAAPASGGIRGNALERAAAAERRRQELLRAESDTPTVPDQPEPSAEPPVARPQKPASVRAEAGPPSEATASAEIAHKPKPPKLRAVDPGGSFL